MFGALTEDLSWHTHLALRLRAGGHPRTRASYFVNIQVDSPFKMDLWQHRLFFAREDGGWEDIFVRAPSAIYSFVLSRARAA
jgi:NADH dehydrogenase [ubiquinone] 1 alpha subcomplex assembly factor 1